MSVSIYQKKLQELGFTQVPGKNADAGVLEMLDIYERIHGRQYGKARKQTLRLLREELEHTPSFTVTRLEGVFCTEALDDTGQTWIIKEIVDLEPLGFENNARALVETLLRRVCQ